MSPITFYPSMNGYLRLKWDPRFSQNNVSSNWAATRRVTSLLRDTDAQNNQTSITTLEGRSSNGRYTIYRAVVLFDTSAIPADHIITSAVFSLYGKKTKLNYDDAYAYLGIVQSNPASDSMLVKTDFSRVGLLTNPPQLADNIRIADITTTSYNDFTLNAAGIANINKSGVSKFGIRMGHDMTGNPPSTRNGHINQVSFHSPRQSGTDKDPKLVVEHRQKSSIPSDNALKDKNNVSSLIGIAGENGTTILRMKANSKEHRLKANDATTGSDNGPSYALHDSNFVPTKIAVSDVDGVTPVPLYVDKNGRLLIDSK